MATVLLNRRYAPWMLLCVVAIHIGLGVSLQFDDSDSPIRNLVFGITGLYFFLDELGPDLLSLVLISFAILAAIPSLTDRSRTASWILAGPQYLLVLASLVSALWVLATGEYRETHVEFWPGFGALWTTICVSTFHTFALLERFGYGWTPRLRSP